MTVILSPYLTKRKYEWSGWKSAKLTRQLVSQFDEDSESYTIWGYDGQEAHMCSIWKNTVPDHVLSTGYTQEQNDLDKADFETNFKSSANQSSTPKAADGKLFVLPNSFPGDVLLNFSGASDSDTLGRAGGTPFQLQKAGLGSASLSATFLDGIFLAGGHLSWKNGSLGSCLTLRLNAPASTVKTPASPGAGNCNLSPTGFGFNIIVPAAGNGQYDLDSVIPIPAYDDETSEQNGFWGYSEPWVGKGVITPGSPGKSKYNLFDVPLYLAVLCKINLLSDAGERDLIAPAIKPKWILPEWELKVTIDNADASKTLQVAWDLMVARRKCV